MLEIVNLLDHSFTLALRAAPREVGREGWAGSPLVVVVVLDLKSEISDFRGQADWTGWTGWTGRTR